MGSRLVGGFLRGMPPGCLQDASGDFIAGTDVKRYFRILPEATGVDLTGLELDPSRCYVPARDGVAFSVVVPSGVAVAGRETAPSRPILPRAQIYLPLFDNRSISAVWSGHHNGEGTADEEIRTKRSQDRTDRLLMSPR